MYPATNKQMHVWASIIYGINQVERMSRQNKPLREIKDKRAWQDTQLTERIQKMFFSGWSVESDEQEMFGASAQTYIRKNYRRFFISEAFRMEKAREMFREDIYVTITEIYTACEPSMVS